MLGQTRLDNYLGYENEEPKTQQINFFFSGLGQSKSAGTIPVWPAELQDK